MRVATSSADHLATLVMPTVSPVLESPQHAQAARLESSSRRPIAPAPVLVEMDTSQLVSNVTLVMRTARHAQDQPPLAQDVSEESMSRAPTRLVRLVEEDSSWMEEPNVHHVMPTV